MKTSTIGTRVSMKPRGMTRRTGLTEGPPMSIRGSAVKFGTVVDRFPGTVEDPSQERVAEGHPHRMSQESYLVARRDTPRTGEDLEKDIMTLEADDLGERNPMTALHRRQFAVGDSRRRHGDDIALDSDDVRVFYDHEQITPFPARTDSISPRYV